MRMNLKSIKLQRLLAPSILAINTEIGREYGMASMMGLFDAATGFGMLFGSLTAGLVMDAAGVKAVFYYGICAGIAGLILLALFVKKRRRSQETVNVSHD
jgi:predicted MFS family arabinose efflux permease